MQVAAGWRGAPAYPRVPLLLWWTPFTGDDGVQTCGEHTCFVTNDRAYRHHPMLRTLLFYGSDFKPTELPLPRKPGEDWALFHEESPKNAAIFCHAAMMEHFNHTATFRRASDMPLTTQYLESLATITDPSYLIPVATKSRMVSEGLALVAYVQSGCETPSGRDAWVGELMKHVKVDSYGACLHNKDLPEELQGSERFQEEGYLRLLAKYKFVIAIENAICEDYVTEKLWRTLQVGAVPIYLGAPNIQQYLPHPKAALMVKDFGSVKEVAEHIKMLDQDDSKYNEHLSHKQLHNRGTLVPNQLLHEMMEGRRWGVSSEQQAAMGNFVKHFQCLVCERVANNVWFSNLGGSHIENHGIVVCRVPLPALRRLGGALRLPRALLPPHRPGGWPGPGIPRPRWTPRTGGRSSGTGPCTRPRSSTPSSPTTRSSTRPPSTRPCCTWWRGGGDLPLREREE